MLNRLFLIIWALFGCFCAAEGASLIVDITPQELQRRVTEIFSEHARFKKFDEELTRRTFNVFLDELDATHTYLLEEEISPYTNPSEQFLKDNINAFNRGDFSSLKKIADIFTKSIERRHQVEAELLQTPPSYPIQQWKDLKDAGWPKGLKQLKERIWQIQQIQTQAITALNLEDPATTEQRLSKRRRKFQSYFITEDAKEREGFFSTLVLKSISASLDAHTYYLSPADAEQILIQVHQKLVGLGVMLRDDCDGFSIIKLLDDGPAKLQGTLKVKDKIVAVGGEPMIGNDIQDVINAIRGERGSTVDISILREGQLHHLTMVRDEVILKETRMESKVEKVEAGNIAVLQLFSFYQEGNSSSANDLRQALDKMRKDHDIKGVILDLRNNGGGLLLQALEVAGLFLKQGIIAAVKDGRTVHPLANPLQKPVWEGPLVVLTNYSSASASEIVAQSLQDWSRAIVVGDEHTFGKGSFQVLHIDNDPVIDPKGGYAVTKGIYYTVSGKTPQLTGVSADIVVHGWQLGREIGEKFTKYPLDAAPIAAQYDEIYKESPFLIFQKGLLQKKTPFEDNLLTELKNKSAKRLASSSDYQTFVELCKGVQDDTDEDLTDENQVVEDFQYKEALNIINDFISYKAA